MAVKKSKKQENIINVAKELFWNHGVSRITVEEICEKANVSKMTFYKFFDNKKELAIFILQSEIQKNKEALEKIKASGIPIEEKFRQLMAFKFQSTETITSELLNDLYRNKRLGLHHLIEEETDNAKKIFTELIEDARENGEISSSVKTPFIMHYIDHLGLMSAEESLLKHYDSMQELIMDGLSFMFYGLLNR